MSRSKIKKIDPSQIRYTPHEGEIIQSPKDGFLVWKDNKWAKIKMEDSGLNIGLYDINKQIIAQLPELNNFEDKKVLFNTLHEKWKNFHYMLYGKEISYFTLFEIEDSTYFGDNVIDCLKNIGAIKAIDLTEFKDALEIWVETETEVTCLYLFPYDNGVVQVGE